MRYSTIENIVFTTEDDRTVNIKDRRDYPEYQTLLNYNLKEGEKIDEIASRQQIYGDNAEGDSYKIVDHNIIELYDAGFNLSKIKTLRIPL